MATLLECDSELTLREHLLSIASGGENAGMVGLSLVGFLSRLAPSSLTSSRTAPALRLDACALDATALTSLGEALREGLDDETSGNAGNGCCDASDDEQLAEEDFFDLFGGESGATAAVNADGGSEAQKKATSVEPPSSVQVRSLAVVRCQGVAAMAWVPLWRSLPQQLVELDLADNLLSDPSVTSLCGSLQQRGCCLTRLLLRGNHCKDVARLCALIEAGRLREVDLAENMINDKSIAQLCDAMRSSASTLHFLGLSGNCRVSSRGVAQLASQLQRSHLRVLRLDGTALCDDGANALANVIPHCAAFEELWAQLTQITRNGARNLLAAARMAVSTSEGGLRSLVVDDDLERIQWRRCVGVDDLKGVLGDLP